MLQKKHTRAVVSILIKKKKPHKSREMAAKFIYLDTGYVSTPPDDHC